MPSSAQLVRLKDLFSGSAHYVIPPFQRAFLWQPVHARELTNDIEDAFLHSPMKATTPLDYFLGTMVLARGRERDASLEIIDGQQRITTLLMLLAALRDHLGRDGQYLQAYLIEKTGPRLASRGERARLAVVEEARDFWARCVAAAGGSDGLLSEDPDDHPQVARMRKILTGFRRYLRDTDAHSHAGMARYLLDNCTVVTIITEKREDAFKIFRGVNRKGIDLSDIDLIKAEFLGAEMSDKSSPMVRRRLWEIADAALGRPGMELLLAAVLSIACGQEIRPDRIFETFERLWADPRERARLRAKAIKVFEMFVPVRAETGSYGQLSDDINKRFHFLNRLRSFAWQPILLAWMDARPARHEDWRRAAMCLEFYCLLSLIDRWSRKEQNSYITEVLRQIHADLDPFTRDGPFWPGDQSRTDLSQALRGRLGEQKDGLGWYALLRAESASNANWRSVLARELSHEHILPRRLAPKSGWRVAFPDDGQAQKLSARLGNFLAISAEANAAASDRLFTDKRKAYAKLDGAPSSIFLREILAREAWGPDAIIERTERLARLVEQELGVYDTA